MLEAIPSVVGRVERKATVIGFALLVASARFQSNAKYAGLTGSVLRQLAAMLMDTTVKETKSMADRSIVDGSAPAAAAAAAAATAVATDEDLDSLEIEDTGYQASFARLATLGDIKIDPCPQITDPMVGLGQILKPVQAQIIVAAGPLSDETRECISHAIAQAQ
ncbi:hypothetical protein EV174_006951 [Coemansia sp. RSA 2320]|nr:hypothetical protein EV174_006951 [Coemansia sp. RSA 2320]